MQEYIHNKTSLKETPQLLRKNATEYEKILWEHLKNKNLGEKFRRQHSVENYILDFYCPNKRLCIELDGAHHFTAEGQENDKTRDELLQLHNIKVLRFSNSELEKDFRKVIDAIKQNLL